MNEIKNKQNKKQNSILEIYFTEKKFRLIIDNLIYEFCFIHLLLNAKYFLILEVLFSIFSRPIECLFLKMLVSFLKNQTNIGFHFVNSSKQKCTYFLLKLEWSRDWICLHYADILICVVFKTSSRLAAMPVM